MDFLEDHWICDY